MNGFSEPRAKKANDHMHRMQTGSVAMRLIKGEMIAKILAKQSSHKLCTLRFIKKDCQYRKINHLLTRFIAILRCMSIIHKGGRNQLSPAFGLVPEAEGVC